MPGEGGGLEGERQGLPGTIYTQFYIHLSKTPQEYNLPMNKIRVIHRADAVYFSPGTGAQLGGGSFHIKHHPGSCLLPCSRTHTSAAAAPQKMGRCRGGGLIPWLRGTGRARQTPTRTS